MDNRLLLVKCITLLYRENQLEIKSSNSNDFIRTGVEKIKLDDINISMNSKKEIIKSLKETVLEMCNNTDGAHEYDKTTLLQRLKVNCDDDERLYESLEQGIEQDLPEASLKRTILNLKKSISGYFREEQIQDILNKASYTFKYNRDSIKDIGQFLLELEAQLEPLQIVNKTKDSSIVSEIDIGDEESVSTVFSEIKDKGSSEGILKSGWIGVNRLTQGGLRRGEMWRTDALQHKWKTGFSLSIFMDIALYNKPHMINPAKKPLLLRISFEDDITTNLSFIYERSKVLDGFEFRDIPKDITSKEMSSYIKEKLGVNGYHIKMMRVDPTNWSYMHITNKIIELEAEGYEVHLLMLDYLALVPRVGCSIGGPMGSDLRDLYRRVRNFCNPRKITVMTPHQLSTESKQLKRDGRQDFVKQIVGLGYTEGSKQLDQEVDGELIIDIGKYGKEAFLEIQRGKHRGVPVIPEDETYCVYKFPKIGPILPDIEIGDNSLRRVGGVAASEEFTMDEFSQSEL